MDHIADTIVALNDAFQTHLKERGIEHITADEAARIAYSLGILHKFGPPGAPGFAFRELLRDLKTRVGYKNLFRIIGATQDGERKHGRWTIHRYNAPSRDTIVLLIAGIEVKGGDEGPPSDTPKC